jgi:hypothetical protein
VGGLEVHSPPRFRQYVRLFNNERRARDVEIKKDIIIKGTHGTQADLAPYLSLDSVAGQVDLGKSHETRYDASFSMMCSCRS